MTVERIKFVAATNASNASSITAAPINTRTTFNEDGDTETTAQPQPDSEPSQEEKDSLIHTSVLSYISTFSTPTFKFNKKLQFHLLNSLIFSKQLIKKKSFKKCKDYLKNLKGAGKEKLIEVCQSKLADGLNGNKSERKRIRKILKCVKKEE